MDELREYQEQLARIEAGLSEDPTNADLKELRSEIVELIELLRSEHEGSSPCKPASELKKEFQTGELVLARWISGDRQFHQARIVSVTGSSSNPLYTVQFPKEKASETLAQEFLRHINPNTSVPGKSKPVPSKPRAAKVTKESEVDRTPQKHQSKWQTFKSKGAKASRGKPLGERSMFKSPETLSGRVGVVNSGKPMTANRPREKHKFGEPADR